MGKTIKRTDFWKFCDMAAKSQIGEPELEQLLQPKSLSSRDSWLPAYHMLQQMLIAARELMGIRMGIRTGIVLGARVLRNDCSSLPFKHYGGSQYLI